MLEFFNDLIGDNDPNTDFIEYEEKSSDYFVHIHVSGKDDLPYHNVTLTARAFKSRSKKQPIEAKYKWFRVIDSRNYEIRDNPIDDTYHVNAYDIGSFLRVAVKVKGIKEVTILKIGPILLNPKMIPSLERNLLSNEGLFNFSLHKYGEKFVDDKSKFQNFIKISQEKIMVKFGFYFQHEYPDFELNLNGPYDYKIFCENQDPRAISIFFVKGTESMLSENLVIPSSDMKRKYDKLEKEYREQINQQMNPAGVELFDKSEEEINENNLLHDSDHLSRHVPVQTDEFAGDEFELRLRFTTRLNRDSFICAVRVISIMKTMALAPLIDNSEKVFNGVWKMPTVGKHNNEYNKLVGQMFGMGGATYRVLDLNKSLRKDNKNLKKCADLLENKLNNSVLEFQSILKDIRDKSTPEELRRMERVNRSLIDTSMRAKQVKEGGTEAKKQMISARNRNTQDKVKALQREIESTNKLNGILIKQIHKLKDDKKVDGGGFKKKKNLGNATVVIANRRDEKEERLNLSGMEKKEGDKYLIGLEDKIEHALVKDKKSLEFNRKDDEKKMLSEAIGNIEKKSSEREIIHKLEKSNLQEDEEEDKLGAIVELELEKKMLTDNLKVNTKRFEDLAKISNRIIEGQGLSESSVEGITLDVEKVFDSNLSLTKLKNLQRAILLKYAESEINQLKLLQSHHNQQEVDFETFQPGKEMKLKKDQETKEQYLREIEDLEENNRMIEKRNKVSKTKLENLRKEVEKLQQEVIDGDAVEEEDPEEVEIRELEKKILELEGRKGELIAA